MDEKIKLTDQDNNSGRVASYVPFSIDGLTLINGDCRTALDSFAPKTFDLVVTSPPFNVGIDYGEGREADKKSLDEYSAFANSTLIALERVMKDGARACIEIGGSGRCFPSSYLWQNAAYKSGLQLFSEIVIEHRKTNETAWGSYLKPDNVYTIPNFHLLYVFFKTTPTKRGAGTDLVKEEFTEWTRGRWKINWQKHEGHPASFPKSFAQRCIKLFGHTDDLILDPFAGSSTTLVTARMLGRKAVGIEISQEYYELSKNILSQMTMPFIEQGT